MNASESSVTILIIDNDEGMTTAMSARLENQGYQCLVAGNGEEGLSTFEAQRVDLVITDLNMPNVDGIEFIQKIRDAQAEVPILVVTGYSKDYASELCHFADVQVIGKPFHAQDLIDAIDTQLFLNRQERLAG